MTFTTTKLAGNRVLVQGEDSLGNSGFETLDSSGYEQLMHHLTHADAVDEYNASVEEFFAPLTEAAELLEDACVQVLDPYSYFDLEYEVEEVEPVKGQRVELNREAQILRMIEANDTGRLIWVNGVLEIIAYA